jgi:hypothetical protein
MTSRYPGGWIRAVASSAALAVALVALGCGRGYEGGGELRARKKVLEREVAGLRDAVGRLERHEPLLPEQDLAVAIDDTLLQGVITAQLPFESEVGEYALKLEQAEVHFRGAPTVSLRGRLKRKGNVELEAVVDVVGALDSIAVDSTRGALEAKIVVDHIGIEKAAGIEVLFSGSTMDEVARMIRLQLADKLPPIQIPVKVQQSIELPAVTNGPVRLDGASMPIVANVSRVFAGQGRLWVAIHFQPGELVKTQDAPDVQDSRAEDVDAGFDTPAADKPDAKAGKAKAEKPKPKGQQP